MFIDTHAHLSDARFDIDRDLAIKRSLESGVAKILEIACEPALWKPSFEISVLNPNIFCAYGLHPQEAKHFNDDVFMALEKLLSDKKAVAVGETGLDYHYEYSPKDVQKTVFKIHLKLAQKLHKPVIIHCREAYPDLFEILNLEARGEKYNGVVHCFSGTPDEAQRLTGLGFYIGIDGPVTYPNSKILRETVKLLPLEKILLETDCPYLPPQQFRGKRNEPSYITHTAEEIASIKQIPIEMVAKTTSDNAAALFGI